MGGDRSGLVMGFALLPNLSGPFFSLPFAPEVGCPPQEGGQTSPSWHGLQRPVVCWGLAFFFCD